MWLLEWMSKVVAGPFKSQAEMAKRLGVSQQYVNRQIRKCEFRFQLDGKPVIAREQKEFAGGGKKGFDKADLAMRLGVSKEAVEKVLRKNRSGLLQTPNGKVKIQKLKPGEKPTLPAVRVLWDDDKEKQDFVSFAAAAKELKIHPKTIPSALKAGRDSFTRKSDGKKFTFEIPQENTPSQKKPKLPSEEQKAKWAEMRRRVEIQKEYKRNELWNYDISIEEMDRINKLRRAEREEREREMNPPAEKEPSPSQEEERNKLQEELSEEPSSAEEERSELQEEEERSELQEEEERSELQENEKLSEPPIPAPRKIRPPIPAPRKIRPPIPAPRKKVPAASSRGEEEEEEDSEEEEETGYTELMEMKTWEILEKKYSDYWCKETVGKSDDTIMLLFHVITGEYTKVRNYQDIEEFFQQRGYSSYLTEQLFKEKHRAGDVVFQACRGKKKETWFRLILCKTERKCPTVEQYKKELQEAEKENRRWEQRAACCYLKEYLTLSPPKPKPLKPPPEEVLEIQKSGQKINFQNSTPITLAIFDSPKSVAEYIRSGLRQKIFWTGPKTRQNVIIDNHEVYLPDLVKEIIVFHIRGKMWKEGDAEEMGQWLRPQTENSGKKDNTIKQIILMRKTRDLCPLAIVEILKKFTSLI